MSNYWNERIEKEMLAKQAQDKQIGDELKRLHQYHMRNIQLEIDSFLAQYGIDNQLSPAEVKKKVAAMDVVTFQEKAKRYVAEKNFSERANAELSLYNLKMNVSRLEMLQHHLDLEMVALADGEHKLTEKFLNQEFIQEMNFQAGILGEVVSQPRLIESMAQSIINTPYHNAVWSDKIWQRQDRLRKEIARMVDITLLRGRNATTLVPEFRRLFDVGAYEAKRLAVTETARIQTAVQKEMYAVNEIDEYEYMAEPSACDVCAKLDGKIFKVTEMTPGKNAAPTHPHCHCSTAPSVSRKQIEKLSQAHKKGDFVRITDQAIDKVPLIEIPTHSKRENRNIQLAHKQLLKDAKENNYSNEVMHILIGDNPIVVYGDKNEVDPNISDSARFILNSVKDRTLTVIHNHPGGSSFSMNDLMFFLKQKSVKTMTAVSNQGKVMYITKTSRYNHQDTIQHLQNEEIANYFSTFEVEKIIKSLYNLGVRYKYR